MNSRYVKADLSEFRQWQLDLEASWLTFEDEFLTKFLLERAREVIERVKPRTPKRTGDLQRAWRLGDEIFYYERNIGVEIINDAEHHLEAEYGENLSGEYASFIEYGYKQKDGTHYEGRFMLTITLDEVRNSMPSLFLADFEKWVKAHNI